MATQGTIDELEGMLEALKKFEEDEYGDEEDEGKKGKKLFRVHLGDASLESTLRPKLQEVIKN
jgi:hypothetical protein